MKVRQITDALEHFAPLPLQDGFDNAGLQIGLTDAEVTGALLCLDVTEAVVDEAVALGYNLIIAHHPLIFRGVKSITGRDYVERCILRAIKNDIVVYAAHTNLDNARGGVNYKMAEKIGLTNVRVLDPKADSAGNDTERVGAGAIGDLPVGEEERDFLRRLKTTFAVGCVKHNQPSGRTIRRVALCGGAGAFLLPKAIEAGADVFVTGEMKYHEYFGHEAEILIAEIGHYESEQYTKEIFGAIIGERFPGLSTRMSQVNTNPIQYL
ncbi:MAG: Nif3-like dinuclear metal center hexameric protein [Mediterranea sp.]|jgi:dinuclear metal center YbgI/SA1388 family protein|nr:Nif3-like dinuclear metal center hexameric protein [Mediterranea sp.]